MTQVEHGTASRRDVVAANVRAWMGWHQLSGVILAKVAGCSQRAMSNKLAGLSPFSTDELDRLADLFGLSDPGVFFRVHPPFDQSAPGEGPAELSVVREPRSRTTSPSIRWYYGTDGATAA